MSTKPFSLAKHDNDLLLIRPLLMEEIRLASGGEFEQPFPTPTLNPTFECSIELGGGCSQDVGPLD